MHDQIEKLDIEQGTPEWLELRKTKITATDSPILMGVSHWKTKIQLFHEKKSQENNTFVNAKMQRGLDLEPEARELFSLKTGIPVKPAVVVKDWAMASLDGISDCGHYIVEIKCPGEKDHTTAVTGKIPDHYYPQLQHQLYVCGLDFMYYFSYDGFDGVIVNVKRNDEYIERMIEKELEFYECLVNNVPPEPDENDYIERNDQLWKSYAEMYIDLCDQMKDLELQLECCRNELVALSGEINCKGSGISLCKVNRKGNIDYSKVPELKSVDLEPYRKKPTFFWKINKVTDNGIFAA